ncbi:MAG: glycosyltransferase [Candidatus Latescibacteria bacterium]|nr:glycosyltransferase [Candidatus Latescibacterota bacterium]
MNEPLVSIVTPSLNQGRFIENTLLSVKGQTYSHIEHIVVDGGSSDETVQILRTYDGTYNMQWISESDRGMYDAINKGLLMARGEILAYLNTDDLYLPWTVETAVRYFTAHPATGLLFGDVLVLDACGNVVLHFQPPTPLEFLRRTGWSLPQPAVFWRRRVYDAIGGFDSHLQFAGDLDYWIRVSEQFTISQIHEFMALSHVHEAAKSVVNRTAMSSEIDQLLLHYARPTDLRSYRRVIEPKLYGWFWQRVYMAKFLLLYVAKKVGYTGLSWTYLLSLDGLILGSWRESLLGFLPFGHRGRYRWTLSGTLGWSTKGFTYVR